MSQSRVIFGDCRELVLNQPADAIVCDPPYHLTTGKKGGSGPASVNLNSPYGRSPITTGFMGKAWDGGDVAFQPSTWAHIMAQAKPGAYLLVFGGTRTFHRLACAIEDGGWELRDTIMWVYGSGFPKSLDVSKAITKRANPWKVREIKLWLADRFESSGKTKAEINRECGFTASDYLKTEPGNDAGGRATWHMLLPYGEKWARLKKVVGFGDEYDAEIERYGVVASRRSKPKENREVYGKYSGTITEYELSDEARQWQGWGTALKPAWEPIIVARKPLIGTVAQNVLAHGCGAINVDGCRVEAEAGGRPLREVAPRREGVEYKGNALEGRVDGSLASSKAAGSTTAGRWPANLIHDGSDEVLALFPVAPGQQGALTGQEPSGKMGSANCYGRMDRRHSADPRLEIETSAARFFYCAKADQTDRGDGNTHPTVKPNALMRYLCRLVTPPGGLIYDPFTGSGSTGVAALQEGFQFVGCELIAAHVEIAKRRLVDVRQPGLAL